VNQEEAKAILSEKLSSLRELSYEDLRDRYLEEAGFLRQAQKAENLEVQGPSGTRYQVETQVFWDGQRGDSLRVIVSVDDGSRWRRILPLTEGYIIAPDGTFIDE